MPQIMQVEVIDSSSVQGQGQGQLTTPLDSSSSVPKKSTAKYKLPALRDLSVNFHVGQKSTFSFQATRGLLPGREHGVDLTTEGKVSGLYRAVYEKIDTQLVYPAELRQEKIAGTVAVSFIISKSGELVPDQTRINSNSRFLAVLVVRALRKAFEQPLADMTSYAEQEIMVNCTFQFEITEHNDSELIKTKRKNIGNQLTFYRNFQRSALEWQAGPLSGFGPAVTLDVLWLPRQLSEVFSNKAKIDPLQSYKDDPEW